MKKRLIIMLFAFLCTTQLKAQIKVNVLTGVSMPLLRELNDVLFDNGYKTLNTVNFSTGADIAISTDDFLDLHFMFFVNNFIRNYNADRGVSFQSALIGYSMGIKMINKYKTSLEGIIGFGWNLPSTLRLKNGNLPTNTTSVVNQIQLPKLQVTELTHKSPLLWHVGGKYRFRISKINTALNVGYYGKVSKSRWYISNLQLTDPMNINPIGFYANFSWSF
jgi:hypothetical protein